MSTLRQDDNCKEKKFGTRYKLQNTLINFLHEVHLKYNDRSYLKL